MAIYHLSGQVISRSQGRSCVAAAAYRSAEKIIDERTELTHDFTKKESDLLHKEILLPKDAPERFKDRKELWNEVERVEKRKDAQLCREFNIALPKELTLEQNIKLAREFVQQEFVNKGMIADLCIHQGHGKDGEDQPHAHVMLTQREITPEGFGNKVRDWNDKALLVTWRERWAETANKHLALCGHDIRIDHRNYEAQGINLEPQTKIGPKIAQKYMARLEEHQQIARENGERILKDPNLALDAITRQRSTFTHQDLARFVNRHTADREQFTQVYEIVKTSKEIVNLGLDDQDRERFTTQEMLHIEHRMLNQAVGKAEQGEHLVNSYLQAKVLKTSNLTEEQAVAYKYITANQDIACVIGFAGTGKSYMLGKAREAWEKSGYNTVGMALSGIAAENLEGGSGIESRTVASHILSWENDREHLTSRDIVVIDEAGMLGSRQMARILDEVDKSHAKAVLVFDPEQLPAIEAGAPARAIAERVGYVEMRNIRRQEETWQKAATINFGTGKTTEAILAYEEKDCVHNFNTKQEAMDAMIERWDEVRTNQPDKSLLMMAYTRDEVRELNEQAREVRKEYRELGQTHEIKTANGTREFAAGDRIYFLRNEYRELNVKNGSLGIITFIDKNSMTVQLEQGREVVFNPKNYNHIDHGYATTAYKAQGTTVDHSYVLASKYFDRHSGYVSMTRHRESMDLFWSRDEFTNFKEMAHTLSRERGKDITLDYAEVRNFDVSEKLIEREYERKHPASNKEQFIQTQERLKAAEQRTHQGFDIDKLREQHANQQLSELAAFKTRYEQQNPALAERLEREAISPVGYEKQALKAEQKFKQLEKEMGTTLFPNSTRRELGKLAVEVAKQPKVMEHIKQRDVKLAKQIAEMAKAHERSHEHNLERGRDR